MSASTLRRELARLRRAAERAPASAEDLPDPVTWAETVSGRKLDPWQRDLMRDASPRVLLLCSRQVGKSFCVALKAAYEAAHRPGTVLVLAPSLRQSSLLFGTIEATLKAARPSLRFTEANRSTIAIAGGGRVVCLPGDRPDLVRGYAASLVLIDEAAFVRDQVPAVLTPTLATTGGKLICLSSPAGPRGFFYGAWTGEAEWQRIRVLASDCPRISPAFLEDARQRLGELAYRQEVLAEFVQSAQALFGADDLDRMFAAAPAPEAWLKPADAAPFLA